ncbi:MAG: SdrD B-like domain-containing protein [bacterium]
MISKSMWGVVLAALILGGCGEANVLGPDPQQAPSAPHGRTASHVDLVVAGMGLQFQPNVFTANIPVASASDIVEARFLWTGRATDATGDSTIVINGVERTGTVAARLFVPESPQWILIYQLDALGIVQPGVNSFTVSGFTLPGRAAGIALEAVYDAPASPWTSIRVMTPNEFVQGDTPGYQRGQVVSFPFVPSMDPRTARFVVIAADGRSSRPDRTWWIAGSGSVPPVVAGTGTLLSNRYNSTLGARLDILDQASVAVPAGASYFAYQLESPTGGDSLIHLLGALCITEAAPACTGRIDGVVWQDDDRDGVEDAGEPPLSGVRLTLSDGAGGYLEDTHTGVTGDFAFTSHCAGNYVVAVDPSTLPAGLEPTTCGGVGDCSPALVTLVSDDSSAPPLAFGWGAPAPLYCFHDAAYWRLQVSTALGAAQGGQVPASQLEEYLAIAAAATRVDFGQGDGVISLEEALVWLKRDADLWGRAHASYLATLLNFGWSGGDPSLRVDTGGDSSPDATFAEAIVQIDGMLTGPRGPGRNPAACRRSLGITESINAMHDGRCNGTLP